MSAMIVDYNRIATHLKDRLIEKLGDRIDAIIVYGSVARKEANENSDIDIFIVTRDDDKRLYDAISKIRTRIDLENDTLTSLVQMSRIELEQYAKLGSPFLEDVTEKGVTLHDSGILKKIRKSLAAKG